MWSQADHYGESEWDEHVEEEDDEEEQRVHALVREKGAAHGIAEDGQHVHQLGRADGHQLSAHIPDQPIATPADRPRAAASGSRPSPTPATGPRRIGLRGRCGARGSCRTSRRRRSCIGAASGGSLPNGALDIASTDSQAVATLGPYQISSRKPVTIATRRQTTAMAPVWSRGLRESGRTAPTARSSSRKILSSPRSTPFGAAGTCGEDSRGVLSSFKWGAPRSSTILHFGPIWLTSFPLLARALGS